MVSVKNMVTFQWDLRPFFSPVSMDFHDFYVTFEWDLRFLFSSFNGFS